MLLTIVVGCGGPSERVYPTSATVALISLDDLPTGWEEGGFDFPEDEDDASDDAFKPCGREVGPDPFDRAIADRSSEFSKSGAVLAHGIGVFTTTDAARQALAQFNRGFDGCSEWTETDEEGVESAFTARRLTVPTLGEESVGHRIEGDVTSGEAGFRFTASFIAEIAIVRRLNVLTTVAQLSFGIFGSEAKVDSEDTTVALRAADAKLSELATIEGPLPSATVAPTSAPDGPAAGASPTPRERQRARVGESVAIRGSDDLRISATVLEIVDPAQGKEFFEPDDGHRYVGVHVRLGNVGTKTYEDSPGNGATLIDSKDQQHSEALAEITAGPGFEGTVRLQPEDSRTGYVVFQIPTDTTPRLFQFTLDSGFGPDTAEWTITA